MMELDQFIKELAGDFLKEIIELFFPQLGQKLDFSQKNDLNKELYTESPKGGMFQKHLYTLKEIAEIDNRRNCLNSPLPKGVRGLFGNAN